MLLCFACRSKQENPFTGTLRVDGNTVVETLGIQTPDTLLYVTTDSTGRFFVSLPFHEAAFCRLFGVATTGKERWQFATPVALQAGKAVHLDFYLTDNRTSITAIDRNNRALQMFREWSEVKTRNLWKNPPAETELASQLASFPSEALRIIGEEHPGHSTADFLNTWASIEYLSLAHNLSSRKMSATLTAQLPAIPQILDVPYWQLFYGSSLYIIEYLQQNASEPEDQIRILQEQFRTPEIRTKVTRQIIERYLRQHPYSEEHLARLEKLCQEQIDKEQLLQQFRDKRYASPGAPLPEVVFEDKAGNKHRLTEFSGKYIYIDLWASWCGPCVAEVPYLKKLEKELKRKDFVFVSISLDEKRRNWEKKLEQLEMHGHQWIVPNADFANMMNIKGIPHFMLYGKDGKLLEYNASRPSSGEVLKSRLDRLP